MIICNNLSKCYPSGTDQTWVLRDLSLTVNDGEFLAIMGRSGSGKSTLLHIMGTLLKPTSGEVLLDGQNIVTLPDHEVQELRRRKIGFVFQQYRLLNNYTAWENICMPLTLDHADPDREYLEYLAEMCGVQDQLEKYPDQMSGGQQQRIALIRALAAKPSVLLADEPTGNLDYNTGMDIIHLISLCRQKFDQTIVMVTHDTECASYADRVVKISDGTLYT